MSEIKLGKQEVVHFVGVGLRGAQGTSAEKPFEDKIATTGPRRGWGRGLASSATATIRADGPESRH